MLEKDPGDPKIDRLRVIHILEADWNLILKLIWAKRAVWNAEDHDNLGDDNFGSRPGRSAIDVVMRKLFNYIITRQTKTHLGSFDNDAKACYDRILSFLAMLASRLQ